MVGRLGFFMGLDFDDSVIAYIHNEFGGHPFFVRQICSKINLAASPIRPTKVSINACKAAEAATSGELKVYMRDILFSIKNLYPNEWTMLTYLNEDKKGDFADLAESMPELLDHLLGYHIVVRRGDDFEFTSQSIQAALQAERPISNAISSLDQRWSEISSRRNNLEQNVRVALFYWSNQLPDPDWRSAFEHCVSQKRREEIGFVAPKKAFSKLESPLYFIELMKFVLFSNKFSSDSESREEIERYFRKVNFNRADAHAKNISEPEFSETMAALNALDDIFVAP